MGLLLMEEGEAHAAPINRVQVVVRVRPVLPHEDPEDVAVTCSQDGSKVQVLVPEKNNGKELLPSAPRPGAKSFEFDSCLSGQTTQADLYDVCGMQELVQSALDGYCITIFAFGQTGSGKTFTMIGPRLSRGPEHKATGTATAGDGAAGSGGSTGQLVDPGDGVLPRCLLSAYEAINARSQEADVSVTASCLELYNEAVTDLLAADRSKTLQVRKDARDGFQVENLTQVPCPSAAAAIRHMQKALQHRHTRAHKLNDYSSRSHCIMTFVFASQDKREGAEQGAKGGIRRYGKLCLVDLAGSERLKETGTTERDAVRETGSINKSLFTLGQVLAALASRSRGGPVFVPYRDSKLTQLLWDGLRGSGRALMLACLGPMKAHAEETLNTLHFAGMALRIKAAPVVLLDPQDQLVLDLRNTIRELQSENKQLAAAMQQLSSGADLSTIFNALPEKLRLTAARDAIGSAPGPASGSDGPGSGSMPRPGSAGTAPGPISHASTSGRVMLDEKSPGSSPWKGSSSVSPDILRINGPGSRVSKPGDGGPGVRKRGNAASSYGSPDLLQRQKTLPSMPGAQWAQPGLPVGRSKSVDVASRRVPPAKPVAGSSARAGGELAGPSGRAHPLVMAGAGGHGIRPAAEGPQPAFVATGRAFGNPNLFGPLPASAGSSDVPANLGDFPELAALEAQFQTSLGTLETDGNSPTRAAAAGAAARKRGDGPTGGHVYGNMRASADKSQGKKGAPAGDAKAPEVEAEPEPEVPQPEPKALSWAERNLWFGQDLEMTEFAYQIHDILVDEEHVDPSSDQYYTEIEQRVREKYPDQWEKYLPAPSPPPLLKPSKPANKSPPRRYVLESHDFGKLLKVQLKEPLPMASLASPSRPAGINPANRRALPGASSSGNAVETVRALRGVGPDSPLLHPAAGRQSPKARRPSSQSAEASPKRSGQGSKPSSRSGGTSAAPPSAAAAPAPAAPAAVNPFNLQSMPGYVPPQAAGIGPPPGSAGWMASKAPPASMAGRNMLNAMQLDVHSMGAMDFNQLQAEYMRQRAQVVEELRKAKEEAEMERRKILSKINMALSNTRWKS